MAGISTYLSNALIDHMRGKTSFTMPSTVYMALTTSASAVGTPGTEAAYTGYARTSCTGQFSAASAASGTNSGTFSLAPCTGGTSTVVGWATFDAITGGNMLEFGTCSLAVSNGITPQFTAGTLTTTLS